MPTVNKPRTQAFGLSVGQLSLSELKREIDRRVEKLQEERSTLRDRLEKIEHELQEIGVLDGAGTDPSVAPKPRGRRGPRPSNERPLKAVVADVLAEGPLPLAEIADRALATGYQTNSTDFRRTVSTTLHNNPQFSRENGNWVCRPDETE